MYCPRCQATQYIKYGLVNNLQRYKCKNCQYQWTRTPPRGHPPEHKKLTVLLYCHGLSINAISKLFQVSTPAVLKWIRNFAKKQTPKPMLSYGTPVVLELDEMQHWFGRFKRKSIIVSKVKRWLI